MLQSCLLCDTVPLVAGQRILVLNSSTDPFVAVAARYLSQNSGSLTLAEDNLASLEAARTVLAPLGNKGNFLSQAVAFHTYILHHSARTIDTAVLNLWYQPSNAWMHYAMRTARYALKPGGAFYVVGPKDRGILSFGRRMQAEFGNLEVLMLKKGWRVLCSRQLSVQEQPAIEDEMQVLTELMPEAVVPVFAGGKLDEGSRLLLDCVEVETSDEILDIGCGAGHLGLELARREPGTHVTLVDASLAAVDVTRHNGTQAGLKNIEVLPSDGAQAVSGRRFDLVVTNPPFHRGGMQTLEIAERFIRDAAGVLRPHGRLYLVANRFLKYEPTLQRYFQQVTEVSGNSRYKVLQALQARSN